MKYLLSVLLFFQTATGMIDPGLSLFNPTEKRFEPYQPVIRLRFEDQVWLYDLSNTGFDGIDPTTIDRAKLNQWLDQVVIQEINRPPQSAYYEKRRLIPEQWGRRLDWSRIENLLQPQYLYSKQPIDLPIIWKKPALSAERLKTLKQKQLSTYTTRFNDGIYNRSHNIKLSAEAVDHHVIMPGEVFSFNETVGPRSLERGYRPAKIIVKGEYSEGIGGGICQTSSTLFNSVDQAGLKIVQRNSHSKQVTYVPENRDATVSWGGPDFRFQNQLKEPILLVSRIKSGRLNISIYGPNTIQYSPKKIPPAPATPLKHTH